jgi:DeoR family suf operon transcriptional repressor
LVLESASLDTLPATRRALLEILKRRGEANADELAEAVGITVSAVRQHLATLHGDGLVEHFEVRSGPGRPRHVYRLTERADNLFPRAYAAIVTDLLVEAEAADPELVERMFERRRQRRVDRAKERLAGKSFAERMQTLTEILDEDGYLAELVEEDDGSYRIVEHNCAILEVATRYGAACGTELDFIREVLPEASVQRVAHLLSGSHVCAYSVSPSSSRTPM